MCLACSASRACVMHEKPFRKPACPLLRDAAVVIFGRMIFSNILRNRTVRETGLLFEMYFGSLPPFGMGDVIDLFHLRGVYEFFIQRLYRVVRHSKNEGDVVR